MDYNTTFLNIVQAMFISHAYFFVPPIIVTFQSTMPGFRWHDYSRFREIIIGGVSVLNSYFLFIWDSIIQVQTAITPQIISVQKPISLAIKSFPMNGKKLTIAPK